MRQTVVVIDVSTMTYCLAPTMNGLWNRLESRFDECDGVRDWQEKRQQVWMKVLKAQLMELLTLDWLSEYIPLYNSKVIFVYDWKDSNNEYWRHSWLRALELPNRQLKRRRRVYENPADIIGKLVSEVPQDPIAYKGGRDYSDTAMNRLKKAVRETLSAVPVCHLNKRGYEADDMMALVVKVNSGLSEVDQRDIVLCCNDSDILGLVSDSVTWFDMPREHRPLVRANLEDVNHWRQSVKHLPPINNASEIWYEKARDGDTSDRLPATGEAMMTLPAIDLLNPPNEHKLWETDNRIKNKTVDALLAMGVWYNNKGNKNGRALMDAVNVVNVFKPSY